MTISAKIIEDSISQAGVRLVTMQLVYPRFVHSELMTHRVFSRNASSSRAIPVAKMIEQVRTNPAMPIHWGANRPGMQAHEELIGGAREHALALWHSAAKDAADTAELMNELGLHKQVANRILEPFQHIHVVVTATEWTNFFELRNHVDAQPEIHELARLMLEEQESSEPALLQHGEWHLPYITYSELRDSFWTGHKADLCKISAARCARVSYLTHDGESPDVVKDLALYERLVGMVPLHASPVEHQATPHEDPDAWSGNFKGWSQHRKFLEQKREIHY
jgi:Thymidylate synthase complementing protein